MFTKSIRRGGHYVMLSQLWLVLPLLLCTVLRPHLWQGSVTNYATGGIYVPSLYALAFAGCIWFLVLAGKALPPGGASGKTRVALYALALLYLLDWATAYCWQLSDNPMIDATHLVADALLFLGQLFIASTVVAISRDSFSLALLVGQLCGIVIVVLVYFDFLHLLFAAEAIIGITFAVILVRHMNRLARTK